MPSTRRARHLAPALTAVLAGSAALAAPAGAAGTQPVDATIRMQCAPTPGTATSFPYQVDVRLKGTAPATTSPGETATVTDDGSSTIRVLDDTPTNPALGFIGRLVNFSAQASGGSTSGSDTSFRAGNTIPEVAKTEGGFGPTSIGVSVGGWAGFVTERPEAVTVRASTMHLAYRIAPLGTPSPWLEEPNSTLSGVAACTVLADQPPIAVVPYAAPVTPRPAVTGLSPRTVRLGLPSPNPVVPTKVTIKGQGFLASETPRVDFAGFDATDVTVIDDKTMTVLTPETWGPLSGSVRVTVGDRTSANTPADDFRFVTGLPIITSLSGMAWGNVGGILRLRGTEFERMKYITVGNRRVQPLFIIGSTDMFFLAPPLAKGMYRVTATNDIGTSETGDTITYR